MKIKISTKNFEIRNISMEDYPRILEMYNDVGFYSEATGVYKSITLTQLEEIQKKSLKEKNFYCGIFKNDSESEFLGCVSGKVETGVKTILWISILMISKKHLRQKIATTTVEQLIHFFKKEYDITDVYVTVSALNKVANIFWQNIGFKRIQYLWSKRNSSVQYKKLIYLYKKVVYYS